MKKSILAVLALCTFVGLTVITIQNGKRKPMRPSQQACKIVKKHNAQVRWDASMRGEWMSEGELNRLEDAEAKACGY